MLSGAAGIALQYVVVGTGYCGTKYAAELLSSVGILCGHESLFLPRGLVAEHVRRKDWRELRAESSAFAGPYLHTPMLRGAVIIHLVRHPILVLRGQWIRFPSLEGACQWYVAHNRQIEGQAGGREYHRIRIEDCPEALLIAIDRPDATGYFDDRTCNTKWSNLLGVTVHEELTWARIPNCRGKRQLQEMAERYGYPTED
jgi:hypothetical protein